MKARLSWNRNTNIVIATVAAVILAITLWWHSANIAPQVTFPQYTFPKPNAYDELLTATHLIRDPNAIVLSVTKNSGIEKSTSDQSWNDVEKEALLKRNTQALLLLKKALNHQFYYHSTHGTDKYGYLLSYGMLLILEGDVNAAHGKWDTATDDYLTALRFAYIIPRGGNWNALDISQDIQAYARQRLENVFGHLSSSELKTVAFKMEAIQKLAVPFANVLTEIKWIYIRDRLIELHDTTIFQALRDSQTEREWSGKYSIYDEIQWCTYSKRAIIADLSRYFNQQINRVKRPYAMKGLPPVAPRDPFFLDPDNDLITNRWFDCLYNQTRNQQLMVAFATRAFQLDHYRLPDTISQLMPVYLNCVPVDLFTKRDRLQYRKLEDCLVIYSVGPDGKDDNGKYMHIRAYILSPKSCIGSDKKGDIAMVVARDHIKDK